MPISSRPKRILIVQTAYLGDVILTTPLLKETKHYFPDSQVDFLTIPASHNILETNPFIHRVWIYDKHGKEKGWSAFFRWVKKLREQEYHLALVPHRSLRSALLVTLARIPIRVGFHTSAGSFLWTHSVEYIQSIHEYQRNLKLLEVFGKHVKNPVYPEIYFTEQDRSKVNNWLHLQNIEQKEFIAFAPGSIWNTKRWPTVYFAQLAERVTKAGFKIVLVGGKKDILVGREIGNQSKVPVINAIGKFSLRESAYLISRARLLVTNDSAPLHMGVAVRTPVLAIFGPTIPEFGFYPYGSRDRYLEPPPLPCRPCGIHGGKKCPIGTHECMKLIHPQRVWETISKMLNLE